MSRLGHATACSIPGTPLAREMPGIDLCVHCGFCLQACPTYLTLEDENDSPRGRILLMRSLVQGDVGIDDEAVHTHIAQCLGCRACETACPSGVPYGRLLEATRETLAAARPIPFTARVILAVFARPRLLALVLAGARLLRASRLPDLLGRALPGRLGSALAILAATRAAVAPAPYTRRGDGSRGTVALLTGCVMDGLYGATNRATARTLAANDYRLAEAPGQRCCGALHAHAGDAEAARALARANVAAFERSGADWIAVNAAGCGAMLKEYGHLLADDPAWAARAAAAAARVRDASELLAASGPRAGSPLPLTVTYDAPCHLLHAQRVVRPPLAILAAIPELRVVPLADADVCCGAAGLYSLLEPEISRRVLAPKLANIADTGATLVATGNPGCLMQIGAGLLQSGQAARVVHPVDLLDASYAASP